MYFKFLFQINNFQGFYDFTVENRGNTENRGTSLRLFLFQFRFRTLN